jgi:hypothetical protein
MSRLYTDSDHTGEWIRLRRLVEGRFIIENHDFSDLDPSKIQGQDTGIMLMATDSTFARRSIVEQLRKENVIHTITDTTDANLTRVATTLAQFEAMTLNEGDSEEGIIARVKSISPRAADEPKLPPPAYDENDGGPDLSEPQRQRLRELLGGTWASKSIRKGDELSRLLFKDPIPDNMVVGLNRLDSGGDVVSFPTRKATGRVGQKAETYFTKLFNESDFSGLKP